MELNSAANKFAASTLRCKRLNIENYAPTTEGFPNTRVAEGED